MTSLRENKPVVGEANNDDIVALAREGMAISLLRPLSAIRPYY